MQTETAFCSVCQHDVHVAWTAAPAHEGHATLPDGPELVCLDLDPHCTGTCPLSNVPRFVMGIRLARSGLRPEGWQTIQYQCNACGNTTELQVIDEHHLLCTNCGGTTTCAILELPDGNRIRVPLP